ncbi:MAG: Gfo/Idh/MocA family oxidoreductase [Candidatus Eisenbacteria bacterium]
MAQDVEKKVRLVIVGAGDMGILRGIIAKGLPGYELVAMVERRLHIRKLASDQFKVPSYGSLARAVRNEDFDTVFVCTPTATHLDVGLEALEAGKHVYCEKPLSTDLDESRRLLAAAKEAGVVHRIGYNFHFFPTFCKLKQILDEGVLGDLTYVKATGYSSEVVRPESADERKNREERFGFYGAVGVHALELMLWYGGAVDRVAAMTKRRFSSSLDDFITAAASFKGGAHGVIDFTWSHHGYENPFIEVKLSGTNGTATVDTDRIRLFLEEPAGEYVEGDTLIRSTEVPLPSAFSFTGRGLSQEMEDLAHVILDGAENQLPWERGYEVDEFVAGIERAAESGEHVTFPL